MGEININARELAIATEERQNKAQAYRDWGFGMFVHWGLSAGRGDQGKRAERGKDFTVHSLIDRANRFDREVTRFDAREWIRIFQRAGAKYFVMTVKHSADIHFCLFKTKYRCFGSHRDYIAELCDACGEAGLPLLFYISTENEDRDPWEEAGFPDPKGHFDRCTQLLSDTIVELVEQYRPAGIWLDGWPGLKKTCARQGINLDDYYDMAALLAPARKIDPSLLVGNKEINGPEIDFHISEFMFTDHFDNPLFGDKHPVETNETLPGSLHWFCTFEEQTDHLTPLEEADQTRLFLKRLICSMGRSVNYLLDTGPLPNGEILNSDKRILVGMGDWLESRGQAIYGTRLAGFDDTPWGYAVKKEKKIYLHVIDNHDLNDAKTLHNYREIPEISLKKGFPADGKIVLDGLCAAPLTVRLIPEGFELPFHYIGGRLTIDGSGLKPDPVSTILEIDLK